MRDHGQHGDLLADHVETHVDRDLLLELAREPRANAV